MFVGGCHDACFSCRGVDLYAQATVIGGCCDGSLDVWFGRVLISDDGEDDHYCTTAVLALFCL